MVSSSASHEWSEHLNLSTTAETEFSISIIGGIDHRLYACNGDGLCTLSEIIVFFFVCFFQGISQMYHESTAMFSLGTNDYFLQAKKKKYKLIIWPGGTVLCIYKVPPQQSIGPFHTLFLPSLLRVQGHNRLFVSAVNRGRPPCVCRTSG